MKGKKPTMIKPFNSTLDTSSCKTGCKCDKCRIRSLKKILETFNPNDRDKFLKQYYEQQLNELLNKNAKKES